MVLVFNLACSRENPDCIAWHGNFGDRDNIPVLMMYKNDENVETHVLRALAFLFVGQFNRPVQQF